MKFVVLSFLSLLTFCGAVFSQDQIALNEFQRFWELRENNFRKREISPLAANDFAGFKGLNYYAFEESYRVAADFAKTVERKSFLMPTSTGTSRKYLKIGELRFNLEGKELVLGAYSYEWAPDHPKAKEEITDLFVPFKDLTNGTETYSAGRYVYLRMPKEGEKAVLDFNISHNPNCAYGNLSYSCTLPPKENFLQVAVKAGEKNYLLPEKASP